MSYAMQGHPRWTGHGGEFWQNVVHWRRDWQTTSVLLPLRTTWTVWKGKKLWHWKMNSPTWQVLNILLEKSGEIAQEKNEEAEPMQKQHPVVNVTGDKSKVWCCKEQHCIGTWNGRSMNQGKLEVVKQEMARVNIDILGISELKWTGMGEFNSDDRYIYYSWQESLRKNGEAIIVKKRVQNVVLGCNLKNDNDLCSFPRQTIQYHNNPSLCPDP